MQKNVKLVHKNVCIFFSSFVRALSKILVQKLTKKYIFVEHSFLKRAV